MRERQTDDIQWSRLHQTIGAWLLGYGLLTFHIGLYLLAAAGLVLLNLYRSPAHFHVQRPLFWWGLILLIHAAFVVVRTALAKASGEASAERHQRGPATRSPVWQPPAAAGRRASGRFTDRSAPEVEGFSLDRAKQFMQTRVVQPVTSHAAPWTNRLGGNDAQPSAPPRTVSERATGTWPDQNGAPEHPSATTRGLALLNNSATHARDLAERAQASARDALHRALGESEAVASDSPPATPALPTWPWTTNGHAPASPPPAAGSRIPGVPKFSPKPTGTPLTDAAVVFPPFLSAKPTNGHAANGTVANGTQPAPPPPPPAPVEPEAPRKTDPKTEWTWMEAAAAAWLARRDTEPPPNGKPAASNGPTPPSPPPPPRQEPPSTS